MSEVKTVAGGHPVPSTTLVQTDGTTIFGDGSREHPLRAGIGGGSGGVSVDGVTILGDGTPGRPLRAGTIGTTDGSSRVGFRGGIVSAIPGIPVFLSTVTDLDGVSMVQPTDVRAVDVGVVGDSFAHVVGIVTSVHADGTVQFKSQGLVTLTTAQWDACIGDPGGGLTPGRTYYPFPGAFGGITRDRPSGPGDFVTRIGVALSPTTLLLAPSYPVQNLGDSIVFARFVAQPLIVGSVVNVTGGDRNVDAAISDASLDAARAVGIVCALDSNGDPIVQVAGVVTLTPAQWGAVTDTSPGMQSGSAYFVDTSVNRGQMTAARPTAGVRVQVGVGFSTTQLVLSAPSADRLS
jgi:hypothetical protein